MCATIEVMGITIDTYYLMIFVGFVALAISTIVLAPRFGMSRARAVLLAIVVEVVAIIGALLLGFVETGSFGTMSLFGTILLLPLVMWRIGCYTQVASMRRFLDLALFSVPLQLMFVRVGCLCAGCCGGIESSWGIADMYGVVRVPVQLIEVICGMACYIVLVALPNTNRHSGTRYPLYMIMYGVIRFVLEFVRYNERILWGVFTLSHIWALISIAVGVVWYLLAHKFNSKQPATQPAS